jgi:hypothetical protein
MKLHPKCLVRGRNFSAPTSSRLNRTDRDVLPGGLVRDDGPTHGNGSIIGAALGATLIVEERFEDY